ncbi:hypothetical protein [Fibrella forsythiae]|uniref:Uncharacterized protein n=1 Tax=Fibrella forsythiae TaxID=2817061 RepID=A0ABS3JLI4_9BACT|nr:hypothetical protein [Fibrella forsythiae]MBO0950874.1 hypothetical protein [Fibrella forsythiae]
MKSVAIFFAAITGPFFLFTFFTIAVSACHHTTADPEPEPTGWNRTEFMPVNDSIQGDYELTATLCGKNPQNLSVSVWYFPADANPKDAVYSITNPGYDDDGEPAEPELAADDLDVQVKFIKEGAVVSNYNLKAAMVLYLDPDQLAVMQITDEQGNVTWHTQLTTGNKGTTCFQL